MAGKIRLVVGCRAALLLALALAGSGCVGARGYFADRWADTKDILTVSVGTGGGAKARVGPINAGLFVNSDIAGLRGGECFYVPGDFHERAGMFEDFDCVALLGLGADGFVLGHGRPSDERDKQYLSMVFPPEVGLPTTAHYYTQLEVAAGVGGTLRLGLNPGELLDFLLGWTTLDIYGDDLEAWNAREEARRAAEPPAPLPAPTPPTPTAPVAPQPAF